MDKTPVSSTRQGFHQRITPSCSKIFDEDSPNYFPHTQDFTNDIDVIWDWNSPQSKERKCLKKKRLLQTTSPKIPMKRHPSNQNYEKLKEELNALRVELGKPDDEDSLCVSPQQEKEFKASKAFTFEDADDFFNDSLDDQLLLTCTEKIENEIIELDTLFNTKNIKYNKIESIKQLEIGLEDSTNQILENFKYDESVETSERINIKSAEVVENQKCDKTNLTNVEFHGTKNFETNITDLPKSMLEEIERKRLEALARLKSKKKTEITSPEKCSPDQIEKKRLQALAKLEAKKTQDIIERNRQEALRRLQISKMKRNNQTLTKQLQ